MRGLLANPNVFFTIKGKFEPIAGRALVLDVDDDGYDITPKLTLQDVRERVSFLRPFAGGLWDRQWATALHRHELNSLPRILDAVEREAAQ